MLETDEDGGTGAPISRETAIKTGLGVVVATVLVYLLGVAVGWEETVRRLQTADGGWILAACVSTVLCLAIWGKAWQVVLRAMDVRVAYSRLVVTFFAATFANYVTPMGQAGGEPLIAYILARDTEADYEQSLASVVTTDVLRLLPFFSVGVVGLAYLVVATRLPGDVEEFAVLLVALAVLVPAALVLGWRKREGVKRFVVRLSKPVARRTERFATTDVAARVDRLYASIELIADDRRAVAAAVVLAYVGWVLFALPLYFSGLALGLEVPLLLVAFLVPVTVIAGSTPFPGGLGAIEGTLVALLPALIAVSADEALAITTLYRLTSYWFVVAVGGLAALWVLARA